MKKLAAILCLVALTSGAFAQGTVGILNGTSSLISYRPSAGASPVLLQASARSYYFALLTAPNAAGGGINQNLAQYVFTGVYATNLANAGVIFCPANRATTDGTWAIGANQSFYLAGWSADLGAAWNPAWLTDIPAVATGFFGRSAFGQGTAGGGQIPYMPVFSGAPALTAGFILDPVPEPTTMALVGLGAAAMLIFRRRK